MNRGRLIRIIREETVIALREDQRDQLEVEKYKDDPLYAAYMGVSPSGGGGSAVNRDEPESSEKGEPGVEREEVKSALEQKFSDAALVDLGLDLLGAVGGWAAGAVTAGSMGLGGPVAYALAAVPDLVNSYRHAARGQMVHAGVYFLSALPVIGEILGPVRISQKFFGTAAKAEDVYKAISWVRKALSATKAQHSISTHMEKVSEVARKRFPASVIDAIENAVDKMLYGSTSDVIELMEGDGYKVLDPSKKGQAPETPVAEGKVGGKRVILEGSSSPYTLENELRVIVSAHRLGADVEGWLMSDLAGSDPQRDHVIRESKHSKDELYRQGSAGHIAQALAAHWDPELRGIGRRVLRSMKRFPAPDFDEDR